MIHPIKRLRGLAEVAAIRAVPRIAGSLLMIHEALQAKPLMLPATQGRGEPRSPWQYGRSSKI
jgi:hypothetical protein